MYGRSATNMNSPVKVIVPIGSTHMPKGVGGVIRGLRRMFMSVLLIGKISAPSLTASLTLAAAELFLVREDRGYDALAQWVILNTAGGPSRTLGPR